MAEARALARAKSSYDDDFYAWTVEEAAHLRRVRPAGVDWANIAEEIESLGRSDRRALGSDLKVVLEHLLKWRFQPERRNQSWSDSIEEHRDRIERIVADSPSLADAPQAMLPAEYQRARRKVLRDTGLAAAAIPEACPFSVEQALDPEFWPDDVG